MLRMTLIAVLMAAAPAFAAEPTPAPLPSAPVAVTVTEAPAAASAAATYDVPTPAIGDAPSSPTILDANGDVIVTGSVGSSSRDALPGFGPGPALVCAAPHGTCPLPPVVGPGTVCECFTFGIGSEQGIAQ
jgi:hypothetical protein